jgi:hypothetical protein
MVMKNWNILLVLIILGSILTAGTVYADSCRVVADSSSCSYAACGWNVPHFAKMECYRGTAIALTPNCVMRNGWLGYGCYDQICFGKCGEPSNSEGTVHCYVIESSDNSSGDANIIDALTEDDSNDFNSSETQDSTGDSNFTIDSNIELLPGDLIISDVNLQGFGTGLLGIGEATSLAVVALICLIVVILLATSNKSLTGLVSRKK